MIILAIDPGNIESAYCFIDSETYKPIGFEKIKNEVLEIGLHNQTVNKIDKVVIEMIASYRYASW